MTAQSQQLDGFRQLGTAGDRALVRADLADQPGMSTERLWAGGAPLPQAKGRGGVGVLTLPDGREAVARDYRRGGALGFVLRRSYLDPNRPERELRLLQELHLAGVPVVQPLAALARRAGMVFRLRLITERLHDARPLTTFLATYPSHHRAAVETAGRVVRAAFEAGLWHPDLHPDNLLARVRADGDTDASHHDVDVRLLDLDRAELRSKLSESEQDRMLLRMARYLRRHERTLPVRPGHADHARFLRGMGLDRQQRRQRIRELWPMLQRELARHGIA